MATVAPTPTSENNLASLPTDAISYADLYARWERGNWKATELDFSEDARQWREDFTEFERTGSAVELLPVLLGRGRRRRQPVPVHRRRAAGGAEVLPDDAAGRRGAPRGVLQALHAGGVRDRRRLDGQRPERDQAAADDRLSQDLRPSRRDGRRTTQGPFAGETRGGGHALPRRHRGVAGAAGTALHLQLPGRTRPAAGVPRGHAEHRRRRAAAHRLRREAARRTSTAKTRCGCRRRWRRSCARSRASPRRC